MRPLVILATAIGVVAGVGGAASHDRRTPVGAAHGHREGPPAQTARGGVIAGRVTDSHGRTAVYEEVQIRERRQMPPLTVHTNVLGTYRAYGLAAGDYFVSAQLHTEPIRLGSTEGPLLRPAIVFYPAELDPTRAKPVTLGAGEERLGIDLVLRMVPAR